MPADPIRGGVAWLAARGLNLAAILSTAALTELPRLAEQADRYPSLLLLGSTGATMWESIGRLGYFAGEDPVDTHAAASLSGFARRFLGGIDHRVLWPSEGDGPHVPVVALGRAAGWSHRSPMGLGIHPVRGLWSAYRGVVLLGVERPEQVEPPSASPCDSCPDRPCVTGCPVGATGGPRGLDIVLCHAERTRPGAPCNHRCSARAACPVGRGSAYPDDQARHHFAAAGRSLARYLAADAAPPAPKEWRG